jgi:glycosyltransferase involved in cell wall biosynthesis
MNILFLVYHGLSAHSGISKKILSQVNGLKEAGHEVHICTYFIDKQGHRVRFIDKEQIADYGRGWLAGLRKRCQYDCVANWAIKHGVDMVYVRSFHNANPFTIRLFKRIKAAGIRIVMEIPTYPYDAEYANFGWRDKLDLAMDKLYRRALARQTDGIVTFTREWLIFGQRTICISNGVDLESMPLRCPIPHPVDELHLIGVAEVHFWHGFDRLIHGMGEYYRTAPKVKVYFHLVGGIGDGERYGSRFAEGIEPLIRKYGLQDKVILYGPLHGEALDRVFNQVDMAVGSLGRHRTGITQIKTLKNREYAARGIPFMYSETDEDFDRRAYVMKVPADESPIRIQDAVTFIQGRTWCAQGIRGSVDDLTWKRQMEKVVEAIREGKRPSTFKPMKQA